MKRMILAVALASVAAVAPAHADIRPIVIAEPFHNIGYLPLYVAIRRGFFANEGLGVAVTMIDNGAGHTNAVLSGQVFGFVGGPEHDAFAKVKGGELRSIVNVVNRGNVYLVAGKKQAPAPGQSVADFLRGKTIATLFYGGTPNSITRYLLAKWHLDPQKDVKLLEVSNPAIFAATRSGQAGVGILSEPFVTRGIAQGLWNEPIYDVPKEVGPYVYSAINVRLETVQKDPKLVGAFVRAMVRALRLVHDKPDEALSVARQEFPTAEVGDLKASIDRSYKDEIWSRDGMITPAAWATAKAVVMQAGLLKRDVAYDEIIDMRFVKLATPSAP